MILPSCVSLGTEEHRASCLQDKELLVKRRELIAIPTTCGTGSEAHQCLCSGIWALHSKLGLQMDDLFPDRAILIQELAGGTSV